jgi:DNA-binding NarL/FixJ family response regulator
MKELLQMTETSCSHCGRAFDFADYAVVGSTVPESREPEWSPLSLREKQLVELVQQAKSNKEIAYEMSLTVGSVKEYMHRVFKKLGVRNRTELAMWKTRAYS